MMKKKILLMTSLLLVLGTGTVFAQQRVSEDDIFGGENDKKMDTSADSQPEVNTADMSTNPKKSALDQNTQIGGSLSSEVDYFLQQGVPLDQNLVSNPNILFLYLDSKLENDNRVFARIRTFYDPTGNSSGSPSASSYTNPYGNGSGNSDYLSIQLQELRLSTNLGHQIFLTIGRQKVKYGTAKFFNPTDFLNTQAYNFFLPSDERVGIDMIRAQVPMGTSNFYATGLPGNPTNGNPAGGYFREEVAYDGVDKFLESGEFSFSGYLPKGQPGRAGFDLSQGVGDLDFYFEGALGQTTSGNLEGSFSTDLQWQTRLLTDRQTETLTFNGEYAQFPSIGANSAFLNVPLNQYGVFAINWAGPGSLSDITFVESNIYNINLQTGFSRLDTVCQFTERISGRVYVSAPWGNTGGAFSTSGLQAQSGARLDVSF